MTLTIGRLCVKIAGRDAGKKCVVLDHIDKNYVLIDGETRRRKCNIMHLEPLDQTIEIPKNANHEQVVETFKKLGLESRSTKPKPKTERPRKVKGKSAIRAENVEAKKEKKGLFRKKREKVAEVAEPSKKETALEELAGFEDKKEKKAEKTPAKEKKPKAKKKTEV